MAISWFWTHRNARGGPGARTGFCPSYVRRTGHLSVSYDCLTGVLDPSYPVVLRVLSPMQRLPVFWLGRPESDDENRNLSTDYRAMRVRLTEEWVAVDADQLLLPVALLWRFDDEGLLQEPGEAGLLKQYGGEKLLNDLLLADKEPTKGSEWVVEYYPASGFTITDATEWEAPVDWAAEALADDD